MRPLTTRLEAILAETPGLMAVMRAASDLDLPDWLIFSGAIYQPVWNHLTGRPLGQGLKDYDLGYFDASDLSYDAEDVVIQRAATVFDGWTAAPVEVRNQARVHLWFEGRFDEAYAPLTSTAEALTRFVSPAFCVGARLLPGDRFDIVAPFGLDDLFSLRLRPNPHRPTTNFARIADGVRRRWPELTVGA
ncbi:MAG: nucleotidyltransferase family protein [Caulobacteraceae bacterium]|jgi:hypothetical protein